MKAKSQDILNASFLFVSCRRHMKHANAAVSFGWRGLEHRKSFLACLEAAGALSDVTERAVFLR